MRDNLHLLFRVFSTTSDLQQQFSGRRYFGDCVLSRNWIKGAAQFPMTDGYPALADESSIIHRLDRLFACHCKTQQGEYFRCTLPVFVIRLDSPDLPGSRVGVLWERCHTIDVSSTRERERDKTSPRRNKWTLPKGSQCYIPHDFRSRVASYTLTWLHFIFFKWHIPWLTFDWLAP